MKRTTQLMTGSPDRPSVEAEALPPAAHVTEITAKEQRGRPFPRGRSGNPAGRPLGARNSATLAAEALLDGEAEKLARKAVDLALAGDTVALRICLDRILPPRKDRPVRLDLNDLGTAWNLRQAQEAVLRAVVAGQVTPHEGQDIAGIIESHRRALETEDIEQRLQTLENLPQKGRH